MNHAAKKGFTIIELMLAMSFIAVLLLGIAMTVIQIGTIYRKGLSLKEVNQVSRDISADFRKSLSSVEAITLATDYRTTSAGGRICLGNYTYIWNNGKALQTPATGNPTDSNLVWYGTETNTSHTREVHLVKVPDAAKLYCSVNALGALTYKNVRSADVAQTQELVASGDYKMNINKITLSTTSSAYDSTTNERLYTFEYVLGSGENATMATDQLSCLNAGQAGADTGYCNVKQFSLVIRAGNRV